MNKSNLRYPIVFGALLLTVLFFGLSPAKASAYTCSAAPISSPVKLGDSASVTVTATGVTDPVYVYAQPQSGGHLTIVQSINSCTTDPILQSGDSCSDPTLFSKITTSGGSVTINAQTNGTTNLGAQNFNIFCSTNKPLPVASQGADSDPNAAHQVQNLQVAYTVVSNGQDCSLVGVGGLSLATPTFNGATIPPNYSLAKSSSATYTVRNNGSVAATLATDSPSANVTVSLSTTSLAPGATAQLTVNFNASASHETFNLTSSCGGSTFKYPLTGEVPFVCTGTCVSPPPPPSPGGYGPGAFPILIAGGPITITEGQAITRTVVVGNPNGYTDDITIRGERLALPPGISVTFNPSDGIVTTGVGFVTSATFRADGLVLAGTYNYRLRIDPAVGHSDGVFTYFKMTTQNKVLPAKTMPAIVNTLRASVANMLNIKLESLGDAGRLAGAPAGAIDPYTFSSDANTVFNVKSWANPALIVDKNQGRGNMGARYFSLTDPMNPVRDSSKDKTLNTSPCGDFGPQMYPISIAYSRDGQYEISNQWNNGTYGSTPQYPVGPDSGVSLSGQMGDLCEQEPVDIFQTNSSSSHIYFTQTNRGGVYRLDGVKKSAPYYYVTGTPTFDWIYPELPDIAPNIPKATGNYPAGSGVHTTVMSGTKDYIAAVTGPGDYRTVSVPKKLSIYSAGDSGPVAEINIANGATSSVGVVGMTSFVTADVQYVMFTTLNYVQNGAKPADANYYAERSDPRQWQNALYVYKFDPKTNTLTKVVEGIKILGQLTASGGGGMAGIRVGTQDGLAMLIYDDPSKGDPNPNPAYAATPLYKLKIFMFSDLAAGRIKDVYQDAGYSLSPLSTSNNTIQSLNVGVSTYVYLNVGAGVDGYQDPVTDFWYGSGKGVAVLRFGPFGVNVPAVVPPPPAQQHLACVSNSCGLVSGAGANSCSTDADCAGAPPSGGGGGGGGGGGAPAGSCDVTLTPSPSAVSATVSSGQSSTVSFSISSTKPADTTCPSVSLSLSTLKDGSGNTVATPLSTSLTVSAGNSNVAIYNVNSFQGTYNLSIKAYGRGLQKTITVPLNVTVK